MTTNHIDQLAQWYADAEQITKANLPRAGDTLILLYNAGGYGIEVEEDGWTPDDVVPGEPGRILARAPKPKPAWHDAEVISAETQDFEYRWTRRILTRDGQSWIDVHGSAYHLTNIRDVTPLIEAKVTDEMRDRVRDYYRTEHQVELPRGDAWLNDLLTVALGLETA